MDAIILSGEYNQLNPNLKTHFLKSRYFIESSRIDSTESYQHNNMLLNNPANARFWQEWRKRYAHKITARNRLVSLYTQVCLFGHLCISHTLTAQQFGPMIILDPTWNLDWLRDHSSGARHSLFKAVGLKLIGDAPDPDPTMHPLSASVPHIETALLSIMYAVAGEEGRARVQDFITQLSGIAHVRRPAE